MKRRPHYAKDGIKLLTNSQQITQLLQVSQDQAALAAVFQQYLQPAAREFCKLSSFNGHTLTIAVYNSMWATRLRYQQQRLLTQLRATEAFAKLEVIQFKVMPQYEQSAPLSVAEPQPIPASASQTLANAAKQAENPELKATLLRLIGQNEKSHSSWMAFSIRQWVAASISSSRLHY